jgi:hypothetical protein
MLLKMFFKNINTGWVNYNISSFVELSSLILRSFSISYTFSDDAMESFFAV